MKSAPGAIEPTPDTIRKTINSFLEKRLQEKLDKLKDGEDEKKNELISAHQLETWVADAARRVNQIQHVTHALKYINPEARGTNLYSYGNSDAGDLKVGTHTLSNPVSDVVGNAAVLDVNKFLKLEVDGQSLLDLAIKNDPSLRSALSNDVVKAQDWMSCFAGIVNASDTPSSHKYGKQLYWPVSDDEYHLLAPLFPTSLVHEVWKEVNDAYFSEDSKIARKAHLKKEVHEHGYRRYPNVVVQNFGGTKPQNISQLNSERGGKAYLLPSVPPLWNVGRYRLPFKTESIFDGWFSRRSRVRDLIKNLRHFLYREKRRNNVYIRDIRANFVDRIIYELLDAASELRDHEGNWTLNSNCRLNESEQLWLNPRRCQSDEEFNKKYQFGDWKEGVYKRFANWLNSALNDPKKDMLFGESEAIEWKSELGAACKMFHDEVNYYE